MVNFTQRRTAGYFNAALKRKMIEKFPQHAELMLRQLCRFELAFSMEGDAIPSPETAVLSNLIQRGMPTWPPLVVERALVALGFTQEDQDFGSTDYPVNSTVDVDVLEALFTALHVVDRSFEPEAVNVLLESKFEKEVFWKETREFPFLRQLMNPQVGADIVAAGTPGFKDQRVDLALPIIYGTNSRTAPKGYVIEVDGKPYHSDFIQILNDHRRDVAQLKNKWYPKRIGDIKDAESGFKSILEEPYVQRVKKHYEQPFNAEWIRILQLALTPSAVARVQIAILEAINRGMLSLDATNWELVVIERDVPCASLAVEDLQQALDSLFALSRGQTAPRIILKHVYCTSTFQHSPLAKSQLREVGDKPDTRCDLLVDVSMLRRSSLEDLHFDCPYVIVRSDNWPFSTRVLHTAKPIKYDPLVKYFDDAWQVFPEKEANALYFLRNVFRKNGFRQGQLPILSRALNLKTVIGLLPTGGGKSLTYQLAAMLQPGFSVVVDPIRSLMVDQVRSLEKMEIDTCVFVNSYLTRDEKLNAMDRFSNREILFLFVSPERMMIRAFRSAIQTIVATEYFAYCVIDEVHCVSEWGHDFRTAYLALGATAVKLLSRSETERITLLGLTATASFDVLADVERELLLNDDQDAIVSAEYTNRDELTYAVEEVSVSYKTFDYRIVNPGMQEFIAKPIADVSLPLVKHMQSQVAKLKHAKLKELIETQFNRYIKYSNEQFQERELEASWNEILDEKYRSSRTKEVWIKERKDRMLGKWNTKEDFDAQSATLIFAPHRRGPFGVTNKHEKIIKSIAIADGIEYAGFKGVIPTEHKAQILDLHNYVGTFIGSKDSGVGRDDSTAQDKDSINNQEHFVDNRLRMMVATKAFGMGIDKPNIRFAIHFNPPSAPESFVQEAGRAGRDGKVAISYVLLNRQIFYYLSEKNLAFLRKNDFGISKNIDNQVKNKLFDEGEFERLLNYLGLPAIRDLYKIPVAHQQPGPLSTISPDKEILGFFYNNSFKGADIEKYHLNSILFETITFPYSVLKIWSLSLSNACGMDLDVALDTASKPKKIIVKEGETGKIVYTWPDTLEPNFIDEKSTLPDIGEQLRRVLAEANKGRLPKFEELEKAAKNRLELPGIVSFLNDKLRESGAYASSNNVEYDFYIGFSNHITDEILCNELYDYIKLLPKKLNESDHKEIFDYSDIFSAYIEKLENMHILGSMDEMHVDNLKRIWISARGKEDTDKTIYRLTCVGIVDDFEVDYLNKLFVLKIRIKTVTEYVQALYTYLRRYYSDNRVREMMRDKLSAVDLTHLGDEAMQHHISLKAGNSLSDVFQQMISFVVDFAYREIAAKRKAAISDVFSIFDEYLDNDTKEAVNASFRMKSYLHLYFNSKYARENYKAKLPDDDTPAIFSLRDETKNGEILEFKRVLQYIDVMKRDMSGSETDNIKHLRGAATRLLRSAPDNYSLHLLKAFALFVVAWRNNAAFQEACTSCEKGLNGYLGAFDPDAPEGVIREYIEPYTQSVLHYLPVDGAEQVKNFLRELPETLTLKYHVDWIRHFNNRFLSDFKPKFSVHAK